MKHRWLMPLFWGTSLALAPAAETARMSDSFVDSVGVNIHLTYTDTAYNDFDMVKAKLVSLGVRHIRDGMKVYSDSVVGKWRQLSSLNSPIKSNVMMHPDMVLSAATSLSGIVESFEGPNESDSATSDLTYSTPLGVKGFPEGTRAYQKALYANAKSKFPTLPVYSQSFGTGSGPYRFYSNGGPINEADAGNIHSYPGASSPTNPSGGLPSKGVDANCYWQPMVVGANKPMVATETGYHTYNNSVDGISERAQAKYLPRLLLEHFRWGVKRTYLYEMVDEWSTRTDSTTLNNLNRESHFGLIAVSGPGSSGVTYREKPAFATVKNLLTVLSDPGTSFKPGALGYTLSGSDHSHLNHVLLQKRDGSFWLVLWQDVSAFMSTSYTDLYPADQTVTITFDRPVSSVTYYKPSVSTLSQSNASVPSGSLSQITGLVVPDEPILLRIAGAANPADTSPMIADVASYGAGEALMTSSYNAQYNTDYSLAITISPEVTDHKDGDNGSGATSAMRGAMKFNLPPLNEGQVVKAATLNVYYRANWATLTKNLEVIAYDSDEAAMRTTDWNNTTNQLYIGVVATPTTALGAITLNSAQYPNLGIAIRRAYAAGRDHVSLRFQMEGGAMITGGWYMLSTSKQNTASYRPKLSLTLGQPQTVQILIDQTVTQDGFLSAPAPYTTATLIDAVSPSARVGDSNTNLTYQAYYKFQLPTIPTGAVVTGARFGFYNRVKTGTPTQGISIQSYEPASGLLALGDWSNRINAMDIGEMLAPADAAGKWVAGSTLLTQAVQGAYDHSSSFLGLRLKLSGDVFTTGTAGGFDYYSLGTSENPDTNQRPYLEIDFE